MKMYVSNMLVLECSLWNVGMARYFRFRDNTTMGRTTDRLTWATIASGP